MIGFLVFLLVVCAAGFIYLIFHKRWQVNAKLATKINLETESIMPVQKINLHGAVAFEEADSNLPKSAPRINQVHMERRMFERPRRKK